MTAPLDAVTCASLPSTALAVLADLRRHPDVVVALVGHRAWVRWPAGDEAVLHRVLPVPGVELYEQRDGAWYRPGSSLPSNGPPSAVSAQLLATVITPLPIQLEIVKAQAGAAAPSITPAPLELLRDDRPRETTALLCSLEVLGRWAESAPTAQLAALHAARCGGMVLLLGRSLPPLSGGERFWGGRVLMPLGYRVEPRLPASALAEALRLKTDELLLLHREQREVLPRSVFQPLTRASVRLALRESA
jgi:hypothetical protein